MSEARAPVYCLDFHRDYGCQSSGVCCTSGWPVPVERRVFPVIARSLEAGTLRLDRAPGDARDPGRLLRSAEPLPDDAAARLGQDDRGACLFFEPADGRLCSIHRQLGESALPTACRQFPRTALLDDRGVFVSLSHYCPTAARMLLRDDASDDLVVDPPAWRARLPLEGLDARGEPPPLLRPGVFFDWESLAAWERVGRTTLARSELESRASLALLGELAQRARAWAPSAGSLLSHIEALEEGAASRRPRISPLGWIEQQQLFARALEAIPEPWRPPGLTLPRASQPAQPVDPIGARALRRYLMSRFHGSWSWYQGRGVLSTLAALEMVLAVFTVELSRGAEEAGRDRFAVIEAIRRADHLLVHLARPEVLAAAWSGQDDREVSGSRRRRKASVHRSRADEGRSPRDRPPLARRAPE